MTTKCLRIAFMVCAVGLLSYAGNAQYQKASGEVTWQAQGKLWFFAPGFDEPVFGGGAGMIMEFHERILFGADVNFYSTYTDSITRYAEPKVNDIVGDEKVRIGMNMSLIETTADFKFFPAHTIFDDFGIFLSSGVTAAYVTLDNDIRPYNDVEYELSPAIATEESTFGVYFNPGVGFQFNLRNFGIICQGGYGLLGMQFGETTTEMVLPQNLHASISLRYNPGKKSFIRR